MSCSGEGGDDSEGGDKDADADDDMVGSLQKLGK